MEAAMPCKLKMTKRSFMHRDIDSGEQQNKKKSKHACIVEAHESVWNCLEGTLAKDHEDHIAEKGFHSLGHYNLVHKFVPMHQARKIPDAKAALDKEWENLEKLPAWQMTKVKSKCEATKEAHKEQRTVHFVTLIDICDLKNGSAQRWHRKRRFRLVRCICRAGFVSIPNDGRKGNGCRCKASRMRRTSSRRSISLHSSKNGRRS